MPSNLLLVPLLAGFWFLTHCHYYKFQVQRLDGYWLLLQSSFVGVLLAFVARLAVIGLKAALPLSAGIWTASFPVPYSGTAAGAFLIGLTLPYLWNFIKSAEECRANAVKKHGTDLDRLFDSAMAGTRKVSLTLRSRKWYVGYIVKAPNLSPRELYVSVLPVFSGYRDTDTLSTEVTTDYVAMSDKADPEDFVVTVPLNEIVAASLFDDNVYRDFLIARERTSDANRHHPPQPHQSKPPSE